MELQLRHDDWVLIEKQGVLIYDEDTMTENTISEQEYDKMKDRNRRHIKMRAYAPIQKVVAKKEFETRWKDKGFVIADELTTAEAHKKMKETSIYY